MTDPMHEESSPQLELPETSAHRGVVEFFLFYFIVSTTHTETDLPSAPQDDARQRQQTQWRRRGKTSKGTLSGPTFRSLSKVWQKYSQCNILWSLRPNTHKKNMKVHTHRSKTKSTYTCAHPTCAMEIKNYAQPTTNIAVSSWSRRLTTIFNKYSSPPEDNGSNCIRAGSPMSSESWKLQERGWTNP